MPAEKPEAHPEVAAEDARGPRPWPPLASDHWLVTEAVTCPLCTDVFRAGERTAVGPRREMADRNTEKVDVVHLNCAVAYDKGLEQAAKTAGVIGRITPDRTRSEITCGGCETIIGLVTDRRASSRIIEEDQYLVAEGIVASHTWPTVRGACWCGEPWTLRFDAEGHAIEFVSGLPVREPK